MRTAESTAAGLAELAVRAKVPHGRVEEILAELARSERIVALGANLYIHCDTAREAGDRLLEMVGDFHRRSPESPGMAVEGLREASGMDKTVLDGLIDLLKAEGRLTEWKGRLAVPEHRPTFQQEDAKCVEAVESVFRRQAFRPPSAEELVEETGHAREAVDKAIGILQEHQRLVHVAPGLRFHQEAVAEAREILVAHLRQEGRLESVRFKYLLDTTRKYALPLLDYFDRVGLLRRDGKTRYLKDSG